MSTEPGLSELGKIEKVEEYKQYIVWLSIPSLIKNPPKDKKTGTRLGAREFAESLGIEDEQILDLCEIPTQQAFAQKFGLHPDTMTDWKNRHSTRETLDGIRKWATGLTKNVMLALYNKAIRSGGVLEAKLWLQAVEGWQEKAQLEVGQRNVVSIQYEVVKNKEIQLDGQ